MKKKMLLGLIAVLFSAGVYYQEFVRGRSASGQGQGPRQFVRSISRSVVALCSKRSLLEGVLQERRQDFDRVVFDPAATKESEAVSITNGASSGGRPSGSLHFVNHSQVEGVGEVVVILGDSPESANCQKFMLRLASGKILLIDHNTELAPRLEKLELGDEIAFCGEYTYDIDGDVIRWTHGDPSARHVPGWLRHNGRTYR